MGMEMHSLYICYFGLREPLVQTQVLPYLRELKKIDSLNISLLTFEPEFSKKWSRGEIEAEKARLAGEGITWHALAYHKRPSAPATLFDILHGAFFAWKLVRREKIDILHARVHVPAVMAAIAKKFTFGKKPKLLFDIRGFFPEEYTDAGIWKENGWLYRTAKRVEKWLFKESDAFVVLTEKARDILFPESRETGTDAKGRPVEVIPCCVDLKRFNGLIRESSDLKRAEFGLEGRRVIAYVGSFGGWYMTSEMLEFFKTAHEADPSVFAMILTQRDTEKIEHQLKARGFDEKDFLVKSVSPGEIPAYLGAADAALSFIKACYSKKSSSPTKIAEYLACGVPIITNRGVGDVAEQVEADRVGAVIEDFTVESYTKALGRIAEDTGWAARCRESAADRFDLEKVGGESYRRLYRALLAKDS